ncbi:MAG: LOG family protein [Acidimicrobiia bacterium]|nr:LOG family protein [Acidimicrobiia bacterium]MDH3398128.1 LOG family protein [Acidimicrobiia bacterium]
MHNPVIAVIGASQTQPEDPDYRDGVRLGRLLAEAGCTVASGGYGGLMEAVSAGAAQAGGRVIGVTAPAVFPGRSGANQYVTDERPAATITERIQDLLTISNVVVALPGSLGTLAELVLAWNIAFVAPFSAGHSLPIVAVGPTWGELVPLLTERLATNGDLVRCVDTVEDAIAVVLRHVNPEETPG